MDARHLVDLTAQDWQRLKNIVVTLAPFSIVLAVITFIYNVMQARQKARAEEARTIRELFNRLGTKAYLLNWSQVGNPEIASAVLELRELIEERLGKTPTQNDVNTLVADRLLFESLIQKGWRKAGITSHFQTEALDFGQLLAELGNRLAVLRVALEAVNTQLRMLFVSDVLALHATRDFRKFAHFQKSRHGAPPSPITSLHRFIAASTGAQEKTEFSEACILLENFSALLSTTPDRRVLQLPSPAPNRNRLSEALHRWRLRRRDKVLLSRTSRVFHEKFASEADFLDEAFRFHIEHARILDPSDLRLESSVSTLKHRITGLTGEAAVREALDKFMRARHDRQDKDAVALNDLFHLKFVGINDPQVDLAIGNMVGIGGTIHVEAALERGASSHVSLEQLLSDYSQQISNQTDGWQDLIRGSAIDLARP
jgi:hypothetical protein